MTPGRILFVKAIAAELGCTPETVRRWYREGKLIKAYKVGGPSSPIRMNSRDLSRLKLRKDHG